MRGKIIDIYKNKYRYDYYDVYEPDTHVGYLNSRGYQGGGPTWEGIIYGALTLKSPSTLDEIRFDAEGDGLAIWSSSRDALETIGELVGELKGDEDFLKVAVERAEEDIE